MTTSSPGGPPSASRWPAGVNRQLSVESPLVGGPRFAAGDIGGKVRIFVQDARWFQSEQHRHHQQVARAEPIIEPVGTAKASGKLLQPVADAILDQRQALLGPGLIASRILEVTSSRTGGSIVLSAANIHAIARARALASFCSSPA